MAKLALINREAKRAKLVAKFAAKRAALNASIVNVKACDEELKLKLHLDVGTAKYTEADQAMSLPAISQLGAMLEEGKGFQITNGGCDGPNYNLGAPGTPPTQTILDCHFHATKPNSDCAVMFQLAGDGTLLAK